MIQRFVLKDILHLIIKASYDKTNLHFASNNRIGRDSYHFVMFTKVWINSIISYIELLPINENQKIKAKAKLMMVTELDVIKEKRMKTYEINKLFLDKMISNILAKGILPSKRKMIKKLFILTEKRIKQFSHNLKTLTETKFKTPNDQKIIYQKLLDKQIKEYLLERKIAFRRYNDHKRYEFLNNYYKKDLNNKLLNDFKPDPMKFEIYKYLTSESF